MWDQKGAKRIVHWEVFSIRLKKMSRRVLLEKKSSGMRSRRNVEGERYEPAVGTGMGSGSKIRLFPSRYFFFFVFFSFFLLARAVLEKLQRRC